ncbi:zinc finger protein dzip1 [Anaeramoeba flamelloides]|uniref:Zinc finger protein dzip1 n=1 Tax=Anaeramoeba flamelloides TaxID=1746091 RepID=A0ABQ8YWI2_9EUKA|nr:zinc finger protein dzip1 [Anaeramoeba flamelloides]
MLHIYHRCPYCCESFSKNSSLQIHIFKKHGNYQNSHQRGGNILGEESLKYSPDQNHEENTTHPFTENLDDNLGVDNTTVPLQNNLRCEEKEKKNETPKNYQEVPSFKKFQENFDDHWVDFYVLTLEMKISTRVSERVLKFINKYFITKCGNPLPKTMRTLNKYLIDNINLNKPQDIKIKLQTLISKKHQLEIERETIKTTYFSPITWLNLFMNTNLLNALVLKNDLNRGILVHKNGYRPTKISNTEAYQEKISKFPDVGADYQIMLGFYYDDFESTSTFSLGGLYMFIDNLDYTWRLKDQTIFLIALLPGKTKINNTVSFAFKAQTFNEI